MDENSTSVGFYDFLAGGGEMGVLIRSKDWAGTALGPIEDWPQSLKTSVTLILNSQHPMWIGWGPENTFLYNDAYQHVLGSKKHPWALGRPAAEVWAEIWHICGPLSDKVYQQGEATIADDVRLFMRRDGFLEETFYSFSYSPIRDESGKVGGLFCPSTDVTGKNLNARRLGTLAELAAKALVEKSTAAACATAAEILARNPDDIPFSLLYLSDTAGKQAALEQTTGLTQPASFVAPPLIPLENDNSANPPWPIAEVVRTSQPLVVSVKHLELPPGPAEQPLAEAMVLPVSARGHERPVGALVVGVNPTRKLDTEYHTFFTLVAAQVATAIANARAYDEERKRAEALAEIDRAKTVFFSNVSHEFRTPLTLILGPTEELLSSASGETQRAHLLTLRHNAVRLQKLVNTLLDYARIEAGRVEATYEPVDIGLVTRELASTFHSAMHRAGLLYIVNCSSINEPVYIDRDMWEKIVLNLLSNALKFTFKGLIEISIKPMGDRVALSVRDSGVGIPDDQLPHLSERFHRVPGSRGRTQEGSGIGLALVQELVKLHGGSMQVESTVGLGTTFTIFIPQGSAHLPNERLSAPRTLSSTALGAASFVEEALRWLPDGDQAEAFSTPMSASSVTDAARSITAASEQILIADDNFEMRKYLQRLLEPHWQVIVAEDGVKALETARAQRPDLVLSDVMMPGLGGFELLRQLREEDRTSTIPVILLSARAGEEAYIEGMKAGADDYIVKPFGARELIARVRALLEIARIRRESEERFRTMADSSPIMIWMTDASGRTSFLNRTYLEYFDLAAEEKASFDWRGIVHPDDREAYGAAFQTALHKRQTFHQRVRLRRRDGQWRWFESRGNPILDDAGNMIGFIGSSPDITEIYESQQALTELGRRKDEFLATLSHELRNPLAPIRNAVAILKTVKPGESKFEWCRDLIDQQVNHMARLMEDLLDLSRVTRSSLELRKAATDLTAVINDAIETSRPLIEAGQHKLTVNLPADKMMVDGDPTRLMQLFANLLNNAAKYTPSNGEIHLTAAVACRAEKDSPQEIVVSIKDTGIGVAPELQPHLFDMFFQAESGKERRYGGLGIGLTLARSIVELHGGSIEVSSEGQGKGSQFTVRLPLLSVAGAQQPSNAAATEEPTLAQSKRVAIVDDNKLQAQSLAMLLEMLGYQVRTAHDGTSAIGMIAEFLPQVALIDIGLPGMDGYELACRLRQLPQLSGITLIAQTGWGRNEDHEQSRQAGFQHHLTKPLDHDLLEKILHKVVV